MLVLLLIFAFAVFGGWSLWCQTKHWWWWWWWCWWWWSIEHENDVASLLLSWRTPVNRLLLWSPLLCDPLSTTRTGTAIHIVMNRTTLHILSAATSTSTTSTSTTSKSTTRTGTAAFSPVPIVMTWTTHVTHTISCHGLITEFWRLKAELRRLVRDHTSWQIVSQTCDKLCCVWQVLLCVTRSVVCDK